MSKLIDSLEREQLRKVPAFQAGDRLRVHFQVVEGNRRRTQVFEGVVIKRQGTGARETFTVRKQSFGVGVERTFPLHSPKIERIEVASHGDVRRAKLYYLRGRIGKAARVRERQYTGGAAAVDVVLEPATGAFDEHGVQDDADLVAPEGEAPAEADVSVGEPVDGAPAESGTAAETAEPEDSAGAAEEPAGDEPEPSDKG